MGDFEINELEDIVPHAKDHLFPEIQESVERCIESFMVDPVFNDTWTFGTNLWKNTWNRFKGIFEECEDCPFEICGKGNEYKFKIGPYILRHHRINEESGLPNGGNAVKKSANQMCLFGDEWQAPVEIDNIVLAIDADIENGLKEIFIGELKQKRSGTNKYEWGKKVPVYLADGMEASSAEIIEISNYPGFKHAPEEKIAEVEVELDTTLIDKKIFESDKEK
jgi:hypothetical protein